jgi:4-hydroxybenzoate polyprenyltransferase
MSVVDILFDYGAPTTASFRNKIIGLIALLRVGSTTFGMLGVLGVLALAGVHFNDPRLLFGLIIAWLVAATAMIVNDIADSEKDKRKWPSRPLPSGLISNSMALIYASLIAGIALIMAGLIFSWLFAALIIIFIMLSYVYARYTRSKIGYLTIMLPTAFIAVVIWTAFSPDTIGAPLFWIAVVISAIFGAMLNITGEAFDPESKPFLIRFPPVTEMLLYVFFVSAIFSLGVAVFVYETLSWPYLLVLTAVTVWGLTAARYLVGQRSYEDIKKGFNISSIYVPLFTLNIVISIFLK